MGTFVTGNTPLPPQKTDANVPTGASDELDASDINNLWSAAGDLRTRGHGHANLLDYGAKGDGSNDDSIAIQAAIDANKGGIIEVPPGTGPFMCKGITFGDSSYAGTRFVSTGGILKLVPDGGSSIFGGAWVGVLVACDDIYLDLLINGNRANMTAREQIFCVGLAGASNGYIKVRAKEVRGDAVYSGQANWTANSTDSKNMVFNVRGYNSADDGRNALSIISCVGFRVENCESYQIGGIIGGTTEPGGLDLEPDHGYQTVSDGIIDSCIVTTAGNAGFQILGKSVSGVDSARDWNINRIQANNVVVRRTGTSGASILGGNINRVNGFDVNASLSYATTYGKGWVVDYCDNVRGKISLSKVSTGLWFAPTQEARDVRLEVNVTDWKDAAVRSCLLTRGKLTGNVANCAAGGNGYAIHANAEGRGAITQTSVTYGINAPSGSNISRAFYNDAASPITFSSSCEVRDCDFSGYSQFNTAIDDTQPAPFKRNIIGFSAAGTPGNGRWIQGEFVPSSSPSVVTGGSARTGWLRTTTGAGQVLNTDWINVYALAQPAVGGFSPTNGGTITPDATGANRWLVTANTGVASFTVANPPTYPTAEQEIGFTFQNASGGALAITWGTLYKFVGGTYTAPANNKTNSVRFRLDSNTGAYFELWRTSGDV